MDPNEEEETAFRERFIICAAAGAAACVAADFVSRPTIRNPYRGEYLRGLPQSGNQTESSSRSRGRPRSDSTTTPKSKKKKGNADKVSSPLKEMALAIKAMAMIDDDSKFINDVKETVQGIEGYDRDQAALGMKYLLHHKMEAKVVLSSPKEERKLMLESFMEAEI